MSDKKSEIIKHLQNALSAEWCAIKQYRIHGHLLSDWGFNKLSEKEKTESVEELTHADQLTERILFLEGTPNYEKVDALHIGKNVKEVLENDLKIEEQAVSILKSGIAACESAYDYGSADLLLTILKDEESHVEHLRAELHALNKMGLENYLQAQY